MMRSIFFYILLIPLGAYQNKIFMLDEARGQMFSIIL